MEKKKKFLKKRAEKDLDHISFLNDFPF